MVNPLFKRTAVRLFAFVVLFISFSAHAAHFRGGSISWQAAELDADGLKNDVTITVVAAWALGRAVQPGLSLTPSVTVTPVTNNLIVIDGTYELRTDTYQVKDLDLNTSYLISYAGGNRISNLVNNNDGSWNIQASIFLKDDNLAPKIDLPILFDVPRLQADGVTALTDYTFQVNTADPNADSIRYRVANSTEMGGGSNPIGFAIDANTGVVTWAGSGALASGLYSAGIIVEDFDSTGAIKSKSGADFILDLQSLGEVQFVTSGAIPASRTIVVNKGDTFTFGVSSGTSNISSASLGNLSGSLTEPTANNYEFTPGPVGSGLASGTYPVTIEIIDDDGLTTNAYLPLTFVVADPSAPTIANIEGDSVTYSSTTEILIDALSDAVLTDSDNTDLNGGSLKLQVIFEDSEWEVLGVSSVGDGAGEIRVTGSEVFYEGNKIGDINSIENGAGVALQIEFNSANATLAAVQALIRSLNYTDTFLLRDVSIRGLTLAVADGNANSNSYRLNVNVLGYPGAPVTGSPLQASNRITLQNLGSVTLTTSQLRYVDPDGGLPASITLSASAITNGQFELVSNTGVAITSFTQGQINNGLVRFVHTVSNALPTYSISANDGIDAATTPAAASIFFSVTSTDTVSMPENQTLVSTVASAVVGSPTAFSIVSGDDRTLFTINTSSGALSFINSPNAEFPNDADANGIYIVDVRITDGLVNDIQTLSITVTDVNDNVVTITSDGGGATATINVDENNGNVTTVVAQDDITSVITYSISGGADQAAFNINSSSGVLTLLSLPDFETPTDSDTNNEYIVEVTADVSGVTDSQIITVAIQPLNDELPVFTSAGTFTPNEGGTAVATLTATDADSSNLTYSITGGTDQADFTITSAGVLSFVTAPDFNNPQDSDTNNSYLVDVTVTDGTNASVQNITVTVLEIIIPDSDNDNVPDVYESPLLDSDGDGLPDATDEDSDGDGIADGIEIGLTGNDTDNDGIDDAFDVDQTGGTDANGDGFDDAPQFTDADADGIPDYLDRDDGNAPSSALGGDSDNDGIPDQVECPAQPCADTDGDSIPDYADADSLLVSPDLEAVDTGLKGVGSFNPLFLLMFALLRFVVQIRWAVKKFLAIFLMLVVIPASAAEDEIYNWYLGAGVGLSTMDPDTRNTIFSVNEDTDAGYKVFAGYVFNKRWSAELSYNDLGTTTMQTFGEIDYSAFGLAARFNVFAVPVAGEDLTFFIKAGVGVLDTEANIPINNINSSQIFYGGGAEYPVSETLFIRAELESFDEDASLLSLNIVKYFGKKSTAKKQAPAEPEPEQQKPVKEEAVFEEAPSESVVVAVILDADQDGVVDEKDACPDSKQGDAVDENGCSLFSGQMESIQFELGSDQLTQGSMQSLDKLAQTLSVYPLLIIEVQAYTDSHGKEASNLELSNRRAQSVVDYLVTKDISQRRLQAKGYGEASPIADNKTAEGRSKNRRVEFKKVSE